MQTEPINKMTNEKKDKALVYFDPKKYALKKNNHFVTFMCIIFSLRTLQCKKKTMKA